MSPGERCHLKNMLKVRFLASFEWWARFAKLVLQVVTCSFVLFHCCRDEYVAGGKCSYQVFDVDVLLLPEQA